MAKKKGLPVHGWLVLDKPQGMTSTSAVGFAKRLFQAQKAGHAGTLDPLATGILPLAFGEATKTVPYIVDGMKSYRFTVRWGAETDTDDAEGTVTRESPDRPSPEAIRAELSAFTGDIVQVPPRYSAIKIEGERAYDLARDGEEFEIAARSVHVERLELTEMPAPDLSVFEAYCGKGTYVRALARDIGRRLGCLGHIAALRRTRVGPFDEAAAVTIETLEKASSHEELMALLRPVEAALDHLAAVPVSASDAATLVRGQPVLIRGRDAPILGGTMYALCRGRLVAICEVEKGALHPTRVFNLG